MKRSLLTLVVVLAAVAVLLMPAAGWAVQYPNLDPGYTQEIYAAPLNPNGGAGIAWNLANGNMLLRFDGTTAGTGIIREYSPTQNTTVNSTNVHGVIATHTIVGLDSSGGVGLTNGLDGYIYANSTTGLQRIDPTTWTVQNLAGTVGGKYGIATLPDGRIVHNDSASTNSKIYVYDPVLTTDTLIYTTTTQIDGIITGPTGAIALADQTGSNIVIISNTGSTMNSFSTTHFPDGLAFAANASVSILYSNNNDGTISKYVLGPGFTGTPVVTDIAYNSGAYGDLAAVGPDCAFYVSQFNNLGYHGSSFTGGTNWDDSTTTLQASIIRIGTASSGADGGVGGGCDCEFYSPLTGLSVPEPASLGLLAVGGLLLLRRRHRA